MPSLFKTQVSFPSLGIFCDLKMVCPSKHLKENENSCFFSPVGHCLEMPNILSPSEDLFLHIPGFGQA